MLNPELLESKQLYSKRAIITATFFGGPLAAGYLVKKNYDTLDQAENGKKSMIIGIISTIILFAIIFIIPEAVLDKIPYAIIPLIYSGIIYILVEKLQGEELRQHKETEGKFYSNWRAAGIGGISLLIIAFGILITFFATDGFALFEPEYDTETYDREVLKFMENETQALAIFDDLETETTEDLVQKFNHGIDLWEENKEIVNKMNSIENLPEELIDQNKLLSKYCDLRIVHYEIIIKSIQGDMNKYTSEIEKVGLEIDKVLSVLNEE